MDEDTLQWIKGLIAKDDTHSFYVSPIWRHKQAQVLRDNHYECRRCKTKGFVVRANTVHHKKYLRLHPELALDDDNLEPICSECHYKEHHGQQKRFKGFINKERW